MLAAAFLISLADEKHACSLASSRTAARQPGSARRRAIPDARSCDLSCSRIALGVRRRRRRSQRKERLRSLRVHCSLRSLRPALVGRCLPHLARRRKACLLARLVQDSGAPAWLSTAARDSRRSQLRLKLLAHRAWGPPPSSSLAEERTPPLAPSPCGGARFPTLAANQRLPSVRIGA